MRLQGNLQWIDLLALTLAGPTWHKPVLDPLAVKLLENQLFGSKTLNINMTVKVVHLNFKLFVPCFDPDQTFIRQLLPRLLQQRGKWMESNQSWFLTAEGIRKVIRPFQGIVLRPILQKVTICNIILLLCWKLLQTAPKRTEKIAGHILFYIL